MALVERPSVYGPPVVPDPVPLHRAAGGCWDAVWVRCQRLPCEGKGDHDVHFAQFGRHIVRWWGEIGETKIDPPQFLFPA